MKKRQIIKFVAECANAIGTGMVVGGLCSIGLSVAGGPVIVKKVFVSIAGTAMGLAIEDRTRPYVDEYVDLVANGVDIMKMIFKKKKDSEEVQEA